MCLSKPCARRTNVRLLGVATRSSLVPATRITRRYGAAGGWARAMRQGGVGPQPQATAGPCALCPCFRRSGRPWHRGSPPLAPRPPPRRCYLRLPVLAFCFLSPTPHPPPVTRFLPRYPHPHWLRNTTYATCPLFTPRTHLPPGLGLACPHVCRQHVLVKPHALVVTVATGL